jgi:hypothetical protein
LDNKGNAILPSNTSSFNPAHPVRGFLGFSANPLNPFDGGSSHIAPFFDFDPQRLYGLWYWPQQADGSKRPGTAAAPQCPIVYFRAENSNYTIDGLAYNGNTNSSTNLKGVVAQGQLAVFPAIDTHPGMSQLSASPPIYTWINPLNFQILSSGLDLKYGVLSAPLHVPADATYPTNTYDDITNFSNGGTLEDIK